MLLSSKKKSWNQESIEEIWKRIYDLIPYAKEDTTSFDMDLNSECEYLKKFVHHHEKHSHYQHFFSAIDDLSRFGYIGNKKGSEALLLKSIIAVAEEKQKQPLWEILHMIIFNKASYKKFFEIYLPMPNRIRNYLGTIIAHLENQQKVIKEDCRLKNWEFPHAICL